MDWFGILWLGVVAFAVFWNAAWGWRALNSGVASYYFHYTFSRTEKPFEFWMLVVMRGAGVLVAIAMFGFGLKVYSA